MRFYTNQHQYYCGIDLHSTMMYLCIVDAAGNIVLHRNIRTDPEHFLKLLEPYRENIVVGVECMFCWYWVADLCANNGIPFVLGHALYMKSIHGGKAKNDKIDSEKIARLLKSGMFPISYVYPKEMRAARDLMRRRLFFVQKRGELMAHVQMTYHQYNFTPPGRKLAYRKNRDALEKPFADPATVRMIESDLQMIEHYSAEIRSLEAYIEKFSRQNGPNYMTLALLKTVPGIGDILSSTILYEIHDVRRFPTVQRFSSYARMVKPEKTSNGKVTGGGGGKIGNHHLKWAFSEATILFLRNCERAKSYLKRLEKKHRKSKALSILGHKLARSVYYVLERKEPWNEERFFTQ